MFDRMVRLCTKILLASVDVQFEEVMTEDPPHKLGSSPFDLFYYNNTTAALNVPNCSEHIDPGYLTVVPCAEVQGLSIMDQESYEWIPVEKFLKPRREAVIFPGNVLQRLSKFAILAGIHRVDKQPGVPRLSLVYELRPKAGEES
jgi:isopenicillin N synthase-like dioxygenase